jgi:hypothetical protein
VLYRLHVRMAACSIPSCCPVTNMQALWQAANTQVFSRWSEFARDGAPWNADEEEWLYRHYSRGTSLAWLSHQLSRTQSAVKARIKQRRNNPALPPLAVLGTASAADAAEHAAAAGRAHSGGAAPLQQSLASKLSAKGCGAQQLMGNGASAQWRAAAVAAAQEALRACAVGEWTADGTAVLCGEQLRTLVASAQNGMRRAAAAGDAQKHAVQATVAAAARALEPDAPVIQAPEDEDSLRCVIESAAASYNEYMSADGPDGSQQRLREMLHLPRGGEQGAAQDASSSDEAERAHSGPARLVTVDACAVRALVPACVEAAQLACEASPDLDALSDTELRAFVSKAIQRTPVATASRAQLLECAAASMRTWEVRRVLACLALPEPQRFFAALRLGERGDVEEGWSLERRARAAARKLCLLTHPDKSLVQGSSEAFVLVQRALQHFQCAHD